MSVATPTASWRVAESLDVLLAEINASAPNRSKASDGSIGDEDHQSRNSDHNPWCCGWVVTARDFTHDPGNGFDSYAFADWLRLRCRGDILLNGQRETRVKYIISNRRIASPDENWAWRTYTGDNPHDHHCHVSVDCTGEGGAMDSTAPWGYGGTQGTESDDMFCKYGDSGDKVWVLQHEMNQLGIGTPIVEDFEYGDATAAKVIEVGITGGDADGRTYGPWEYATLQDRLRILFAQQYGSGESVGVGSIATVTGEVIAVEGAAHAGRHRRERD